MCKYCDNSVEKHVQEMKEFKEKMLKAGPEACRKFLISTGIYNEDGTLKEEYK